MTEACRWMLVAGHLRAWRQAVLGLLMALVLVQTLGVLHRVAHAQQSMDRATVAAAETTAGLNALWGEHTSSAECQLFDQACPDLLHTPIAALPTSLPLALWTTEVLAERFALFERFYAARGPPVGH
jgi:hypothetical protein